MRRCRGLFRLLGAFSRHPISADYIISMFEFDFRPGQDAHPSRSRSGGVIVDAIPTKPHPIFDKLTTPIRQPCEDDDLCAKQLQIVQRPTLYSVPTPKRSLARSAR